MPSDSLLRGKKREKKDFPLFVFSPGIRNLPAGARLSYFVIKYAYAVLFGKKSRLRFGATSY